MAINCSFIYYYINARRRGGDGDKCGGKSDDGVLVVCGVGGVGSGDDYAQQ